MKRLNNFVNPKFVQENCKEGDRIDKRQSEVVKKYKPDIIFFELPQGESGPDTVLNKYNVNNKPYNKIKEIEDRLNLVYTGSHSIVKEFIKWLEDVV